MVPELPDFPYALELGFDAVVGLTITSATGVEIVGEVKVRDELKQPFGLVHGGVYATIAETLASLGTAWAVMAQGRSAVGLANQTSFLRPVRAGTIHAVARLLHRGRTTFVWEVEMRDDDGRLCVVTRMTVAVREPR